MAGTRKELLGAHMSIAGSPHLAAERGRSVGCDAIQIFTKAPSQWAAKEITEQDGVRFREACVEHRIASVVAHNSYLINLGSFDGKLWKRSIAAMADEMERCRTLGVDKIVAHPGAHQGNGIDAGIARIAKGLDAVFETLPAANKVTILLETTAGMGTSVGHTFEQLAAVRKACKAKRRVGYCLDTAHILAAGYEYRTPASYEETIAAFDRVCGLRRLGAVHLNDSKKDLGTRVDRHDRVGEGFAGRKPLARFVADERLTGVPIILEIPGGMDAYREDILALRRSTAAMRASRARRK